MSGSPCQEVNGIGKDAGGLGRTGHAFCCPFISAEFEIDIVSFLTFIFYNSTLERTTSMHVSMFHLLHDKPEMQRINTLGEWKDFLPKKILSL